MARRFRCRARAGSPAAATTTTTTTTTTSKTLSPQGARKTHIDTFSQTYCF